MEIVRDYKPVLKNEVPVYLDSITELFSKYNVYVFGYGSLLTAAGWMGRGMSSPPARKSLIECELKGFERGPYGVYGYQSYYGVIRNSKKQCNGVLGKVLGLRDWANLMNSEMAAGITKHVNYRVVDVTEDICNITDAHNLKTPYKIHCVCNRPINRTKVLAASPAPGYYAYCWDGILRERSQSFANKFLKAGGFRDGFEVAKWIDKEAGCND